MTKSAKRREHDRKKAQRLLVVEGGTGRIRTMSISEDSIRSAEPVED